MGLFLYFYIMIEKIYAHYVKNNKVSTDTRKIEKGSIFFALKGERFNANEFAKQALEKGAAYAIVDEKEYQTDKRIILVNDVLETLQELATYHRIKLGIPLVSLTGSNGKTTTKELMNVVLLQKFKTTATKGNLNNHIGVPLTLLSMTSKTEIGIVELGANHPKEIAFLCNIAKPDYGYITNFGKAHLEGFGSIEGVIKAKTEMYDYLRETNKTIFVNANDVIQVEKAKGIKTVSFGTEKSEYNIAFVSANPFVKVTIDNIEIESKLIGSYNYNNIAAAIAIGRHFKIENEQIKKAIENYKPTNNRSQIINTKTNKIILDAYNANPSSMQSALDNLIQLSDKNKVAILGDMFELGDYAEKEHQYITDLVGKSNFTKIYLIGENFAKTKSTSEKVKIFTNYEAFKNAFTIKLEDTTILIKASRGMALERVLDFID